MLLTLRSLLWRHAPAISGTCDSQQSGQSCDSTGVLAVAGGGGYGLQPYGQSPYGLPAVAPVVSDTGGLGGGSLPARRRRGGAVPAPIALPEIIRIPAIAGRVESIQLPSVAAARASLGFIGTGSEYQSRQDAQAFGEMIDTELEMMTALLMEVA